MANPSDEKQSDRSEADITYQPTSVLLDTYHHDQPERHSFGLAFHNPVDPQPVGTVAFPGISDTPAREDHVHAGASGGGGPSGSFRYVQATSATVWNIPHNLGYFPNLTAVDSSKREIFGELDYIDANNCRLTFSAAVAGEAYAS